MHVSWEINVEYESLSLCGGDSFDPFGIVGVEFFECVWDWT